MNLFRIAEKVLMLRKEWDNLGHMVCFHKQYTLGDKTDLNSDNFNGWEEIAGYLVKELKAVIIYPLYLYDHSGITIKIGDFYNCGLPQGHARFDSGQVGFIYVTKEDLKREKLTKARAKKVLQGEIEEYDKYLRGEVFSLRREIYDKNKKRLGYDAFGGYYGWDCALLALKTEI